MPNKKETDKDTCELTEEELDELMVKTAKKEIRSDYRRSLGCENSRRCMEVKSSSGKK
ncbi:hypothetical protein [Methanococcoides burtonii]|uniref:hypothetical protein n=1 Tax=Methanococcoides burtonii TaxID=29291 RepID=UPI000039933A|nr:hypothetical protein [Methanococcoides burtonii]